MKKTTTPSPVPRSGARVIVEAFERMGCKALFGYPGGQIIDTFDEIIKSEKLHLILPRHEQGAVHMADGYARATGEVGCCIVTSGPGATNTVTGLATANMDGVPLICVTGQVPTSLIGNDAFQEADTCGITRSVTKHNFLVRNVDDLPGVMAQAFHIASTGKPGPVLIDVPKDVQKALTKAPFPEQLRMRGYRPSYDGHAKMLERLASAINTAERPLLYVGGGVISANAADLLTELAHKANIPVTTTLMGLGAFPENDPLSLELLGMHGTMAANLAVSECDLLISVGARFDDRVTGKISEFAPKATVAHIDIDPSCISKSVECDIPVVGHIHPILEKLLPLVKTGKKRTPWLTQCATWKKEHSFQYEAPSNPDAIHPARVIEEVYAASKGKAIVATDVGQHQMFAAQFYQYSKPRTYLSSGGLGTMGFGFPAAIGAQIGCPSDLVVCITGDGSFQMNLQELVVAVEHRLPVKVILFNNGYLGMVRQWQDLFYGHRHSATILTQDGRPANEGITPDPKKPRFLPDFLKLAEAYGAKAARIQKVSDLAPALKKAFADKHTWLIEVYVEPESDVLPMVPPGGTVADTVESLHK